MSCPITPPLYNELQNYFCINEFIEAKEMEESLRGPAV